MCRLCLSRKEANESTYSESEQSNKRCILSVLLESLVSLQHEMASYIPAENESIHIRKNAINEAEVDKTDVQILNCLARIPSTYSAKTIMHCSLAIS